MSFTNYGFENNAGKPDGVLRVVYTTANVLGFVASEAMVSPDSLLTVSPYKLLPSKDIDYFSTKLNNKIP